MKLQENILSKEDIMISRRKTQTSVLSKSKGCLGTSPRQVTLALDKPESPRSMLYSMVLCSVLLLLNTPSVLAHDNKVGVIESCQSGVSSFDTDHPTSLSLPFNSCTNDPLESAANGAHDTGWDIKNTPTPQKCLKALSRNAIWSGGNGSQTATLSYEHTCQVEVCTEDPFDPKAPPICTWEDTVPVPHTAELNRQINSCNTYYNIASAGFNCVHTNQAPTANIGSPANGTVVTATIPVIFSSAGTNDPDGNNLSYNWDFGDGSGDSLSNPSHTYAATSTGQQTVTLTVNDGDPIFTTGSSMSIGLSVAPASGPPLNLSITPSPAIPNTSDTVTFTFSADDPDDAILNFHIAFGDTQEYNGNQLARGQSHTTTHSYPTPGTYTVVMTVFGGTETTVHSFDLRVINEAPIMGQIIVQAKIIEQQPAIFTVSASDAENDLMTYSFDYGDGTTDSLVDVSNGQSFTHTYITPGNYTVSFFAFDAFNAPNPSVTSNITVADNLPPTTATLSTNLGNDPNLSVDMATLVDFTVSATDPENDTLSYYIAFGDGTEDELFAIPSGSSQVFTHSYATPGSITVVFSAFDTLNVNAPAVASVDIEVKNNTPPHTLNIVSVPPTNGFIDQVVTFNLSATDIEGNLMDFYVAFGDGNVSTPVGVVPDAGGVGTTSITHKYTVPSGTVPYTATLFVNDYVSPTNVQIATTNIAIGSDASPVVSGITLTPTEPKINEQVSLKADATDADSSQLSYTWTFSDDNTTITETTGTVTHTFSIVDTVDVTVSVTDNITPPVSFTKSISVTASGPIAGLDPGVVSEGQCPWDTYANGSDPISNANGNVYEREVDYVGTGPLPLRFERYYNSTALTPSALGGIWRHNYERSVSLTQQNTIALVTNGRGTDVTFRLEAGAWVPAVATGARLSQTAGGWVYTRADNLVEQFNSAGKLASITNLAGHSIQLTYNTTGQLDTITDNFKRTLTLAYNATSGFLETVTDPAADVITFAYLAGKLSSVTFADSSKRGYHYDDANVPNGLTRIVDENNQLYVKFVYDGFGRGLSSSLGGDILNKNLTRFQYIDSGTTIVTDGLGQSRTFKHEVVNGIYRTLQHDPMDPECTTCGVSQRSTTYDTAGSPDLVEDFNGTITDYDYDPMRGLEIQRIEAKGTLDQRTVITQWHPSLRVKTCIVEEQRTSVLTYTTQGQLEIRKIIDTTDPVLFATPASKLCDAIMARPDFTSLNSRAWKYTYVVSGMAAGLIETIDGPRTDVTDVTTYTYDSATGYLKTVSNALAHATEYLLYDAHGRPTEIRDVNGRMSKLTYNRRNQVIFREVGNAIDGFEITENIYDPVGNLDQVKLPNGAFIDYAYDAAHRLTDIKDQLGNHIRYDLDALGNRKKIDTFDPSGVLTRTQSHVFTAANRLDSTIGAGTPPQITDYVAFDGNGNLLEVLDPEGNLTKSAYDKLGRLGSEIKDANATAVGSQYTYDADDRITSVTDANNNVTIYEYDGLGNIKKKTSPDSGVMDYSKYDAAGNLLSRTDANMKLTTYTYDALNRIDLETYDDASTAEYTYDVGANAVGRLSSIADVTGNTEYGYDYQGRLTTKTQTIGTVSLTVAYHYDALGNMDSMTYPSGEVVKYTYDPTTKLLNKLSLVGISIDTALIQGLVFDPFGPLINWTWGNGVMASRSYDLDGQVTGYDLAAQTRTLTYFPNGNVNTITDPSTAGNNQTYGYDAINRLTKYSGGTETQVYGYDANGNRDSLTLNGTAYTSVVIPGSNRLESAGGPVAKVYSYDLAGNVISDGVHSYQYDARGGMKSVDSGYALYEVNTQKLRVKVTKVVPGDANGDHAINALDTQVVIDEILNGTGAAAGNPDCNSDGQINVLDLVCINVAATAGRSGTRLFVYDEAGRLIGEYTATGQVIREYVWLEDKPMVVLDSGTVYYVYNDHLNTPRAITTGANNTLVWRWHSDAFGSMLPQQDPDGDGQAFEFNLRFSGQYYDSETRLHYNYFRYYDPSTGRYITSDPIGLKGGLNTYGYVGGNPLSFIDPYGLDAAVGTVPQTGINISISIPAWARNPAGFAAWAATFSSSAGLGSEIIPSGPYNNQNEKRPKDCPNGTKDIDKAKKKYKWDKDKLHGIKDAAHGGLGTGKSWTGVAPDGTVGINEDGVWSPQGHWEDLL